MKAEKLTEKLIEIIMHVGGFRSESFTINDVVKELKYVPSCPECLKLASELAALKSKDKRKESWRDFTMTDKIEE